MGTEVILSPYAAELEFPAALLSFLKVDGYCFSVETVPDFVIMAIDHLNQKDLSRRQNSRFVNLLCNFYKWSLELPEDIRHICIYSSNPQDKECPNPLNKKALINHERFHALTFAYPGEVINIIDHIMYLNFPERWGKFSQLLNGWQCHSSIREIHGEAWVAVVEGLARIAAVIHSHPDQKRWIANSQFISDPELLLLLSKDVEKYFGSAEYLLDAAYNHKLTL